MGRGPLGSADGATAVEYAIMAALIAAVIIGVIGVLGSQTNDAMCAPLDEWEQAVPGSVDFDGECA